MDAQPLPEYSTPMRAGAAIPLLLLAGPTVALGQRDSVLSNRWVGRHQGRPLHFEFYGDTMLVVNDQHALNFELSRDSLLATGDTLVTGHYRLAFGRLVFTTPDGVVTMSKQSALARPLDGRWEGPLGTPDDQRVELETFGNGVARWRAVPDGSWTVGEWDRAFRIITFTWQDRNQTEWQAQYDPIGNALLFERTVPHGGTTILRRVYR